MAVVPRIETALTSLKDIFLTQPERPMREREVACLCHLDADLCRSLLIALHDVRFLMLDEEGRYRLAAPFAQGGERALVSSRFSAESTRP
jgi:hypothetical protein